MSKNSLFPLRNGLYLVHDSGHLPGEIGIKGVLLNVRDIDFDDGNFALLFEFHGLRRRCGGRQRLRHGQRRKRTPRRAAQHSKCQHSRLFFLIYFWKIEHFVELAFYIFAVHFRIFLGTLLREKYDNFFCKFIEEVLSLSSRKPDKFLRILKLQREKAHELFCLRK